MSPVESTSRPQITPPPKKGVTDWYQRQLDTGTTTPEVIRRIKTPEVVSSDVIGINDGLVNLETGTLQQVVMAVKPRYAGSTIPDTIRVVMQVANDRPRDFKNHIIRKDSSFTEIAASDPGLNPRPLRYNVIGPTPDIVEVRVNGVLRPQGLEPEGYQLHTGPNSKVPPNSIIFNESVIVTGRTQVDITITKSAGAGQIETCLFHRQDGVDESRIPTGAYENIRSVKKLSPSGNWDEYELYVMDLAASGLKINSIMIPADVQVETAVDFNSAFFLLARAPYTQIDRYPNICVPIKNFSFTDNRIVKYYNDPQTKRATMRIAIPAIDTVYPLLRFVPFKMEIPIKTAIAGHPEQVTVDGSVIVGPD